MFRGAGSCVSNLFVGPCRGAGAEPHSRGRTNAEGQGPHHTAGEGRAQTIQHGQIQGFLFLGLGEAGSTAWQHATWLDGPSLFVSFRIVLYRFVSIRIDCYLWERGVTYGGGKGA